MLVELTVENLAIIERAHLAFGPGFTAFTGETGAGKSLLIDAIELALGERADSDLVRRGASKANVQLVIDLSHSTLLRAILAEAGFDPAEDALYIQREVFAEGRSQVRIDGRMAPVATLKAIGRALVDLHGQHQHQALVHPETHAAFLDAWIGEAAEAAKGRVATAHTAWRHANDQLTRFQRHRNDREQRLDMLRFQQEEIRTVDPVSGEYEQIESSVARLQHAERLRALAATTLESLTDGEFSASDRIGAAVSDLEGILRFDPGASALAEQARAIQTQLTDVIYAVRDYAESIDGDPAELESRARRLDDLRRLRRKYGADEDAVIAHLAQVESELAQLEDGNANEESLTAAATATRIALEAEAQALYDIRAAHTADFAQQVTTHLTDLAMERARFGIVQTPHEIDVAGGHHVEFLFSANAGEDLKPLAKIASGGEISRAMLAIKSVLAESAGAPTMIFDEVDAGLGGRAAAAVARKLEELARHRQVIVISHSPQIAARASSHFRIEKSESDGRVRTTVESLNPAERQAEIARMLAGDTVTDAAIANARELLGA